MKYIINNVILILFHIFLTPSIASAEVNGYLCVPDKATGFTYKNKKWISTDFDVRNTKYTLINKDGKWLWRKMGEPYQDKYPLSCTKHNNGYIDCEFMYRNVSFNSQTLRFQIYNNGTYVVDEEMKKDLENKNHNNAIAMEIGTCSGL